MPEMEVDFNDSNVTEDNDLELTVGCSQFSSWDFRSKSWRTTEMSSVDILTLSILVNEFDGEKDVLMVVLLNKDVLFRICLSDYSDGAEDITFIAGECSILCAVSQNDKFRLEIICNSDVIRVFDKISSFRFKNIKQSCLQSWQEDIVHSRLKEIFSGKPIQLEPNETTSSTDEKMHFVINAILKMASHNNTFKELQDKIKTHFLFHKEKENSGPDPDISSHGDDLDTSMSLLNS